MPTNITQATIAPIGNNQQLVIGIRIAVESLRINTQTMLIDTNFKLRMWWYDPRVTFINLKQASAQNSLPTNGSLWNPTVEFVNTLNHEMTLEDDRLDLHAIREHVDDFAFDTGVAEESKSLIVNNILHVIFNFNFKICLVFLNDKIFWRIFGFYSFYINLIPN